MKWVAESNRPPDIASDRILINLLTIGRPHLKVPDPNTVQRDVKATYAKCREHMTKLLQDYPGRIHIATRAWPAIKHREFVAWTVHLEHENRMLALLLGIRVVEVPKFNTDVPLALKAIQKMFESYGLEKKVRQTLPLLFQSHISPSRSSA